MSYHSRCSHFDQILFRNSKDSSKFLSFIILVNTRSNGHCWCVGEPHCYRLQLLLQVDHSSPLLIVSAVQVKVPTGILAMAILMPFASLSIDPVFLSLVPASTAVVVAAMNMSWSYSKMYVDILYCAIFLAWDCCQPFSMSHHSLIIDCSVYLTRIALKETFLWLVSYLGGLKLTYSKYYRQSTCFLMTRHCLFSHVYRHIVCTLEA